MASSFSRRRILTTGAGVALGGLAATGAAQAATASAAGARTASPGAEETRSLDELYRDAVAEGGRLVIYAGGDTATQQDATAQAFRTRFPDIDLTMVVDYSKYHDVRVDNQLATDTLVPDVVQLQTLQDFTRWKRQGKLLPYKPAGFSRLYKDFRDPQGAWTAIRVTAFSYMYGVEAVAGNAPKSPQELVDPRWKGAIASSYPHDDDAVLYLFSLYQEAYGWDWIAKFAAQQPQFNRGSHSPGVAVNAKQKAIGVGGSGSLTAPATAPTRFAVADGHPFMAWGQRAAILKKAAHPTAAKLYLNWALSDERQQGSSWSVRTDITPTGGLKPIWTYPNAHLDGFPRFMEDRAQVERWKQTFALYFGEVKGDPTPGFLGLHPGR
ncbi:MULTISPECIES: ABC transporter substrate-binding protein [Streptomyces]|uniref:ABC transporter substrate-binding protein n=1 Tax=Streptomyces caniscabiei TaxID=2746961 RepID=A0ABU4MWG0_9ACTN|nr:MULTISPECIES: ABC transporter substrate-binding protein [Streptomyces]MBE4733893.1 ABC transporter substrate-binding protein [Streptomyces caniscabiei]MBE4755070.1 ABC transporter substrate-binding protein [Streptomyces caniscabiei]MBE4768110.1 ABC transporter substrate-binding protein [Streptomyces caniscabiei]MBE4782388.1 ABC transporter substrate-binding protein [Streptomyces caniscabiei]MBE4793676.1 ABC transporter substrate-binding protein [Streptomyces caniscabiei]